MALQVTDLEIDPRSLGNMFLLVEVRPAYEYKDGKRTDEITGYRYVCALPKHKMEKIGVKIEQKVPLIELEEEEDMKAVMFTGLTVGTYFANGTVNVSAKADGISAV